MAPSAPLPVPNATEPFWRTELHPLDTHRSTPELPSHVDIAIIGAGYAGASVAYHILQGCQEKSTPPPSILILEAREACSGATGRNGGHLKPDPYNRPASLASTHSPAIAAECAAFEAATLAAVKKLVEDEQIDCDFVLTRAVDALMTDDVHARMKAGADRLRGAAVLDGDVWYEGDAAKAAQLSDVKGVRAVVSYSAGHVWPYKLVLALLQKAVDAGVNLQTRTPVVRVDAAAAAREAGEGEGEGGVVLWTEARGAVRARKVVYATNGYTASVLPEFARKVVPVKGLCCRIVVPAGRRPAPLLPHSYIIRWSASEYEYLIPRTDGSIVVGGARSRYYAALGSWYDTVGDDTLITAGDAHRYFDGYMQRLFRGWEDSGAYTDQVWTGVMGYSTDSSPFIGEVPGRPGQFVLAGFTGHGMPQIFLAAKGIAAMVVEGVDFKDTGVPSIYQVTEERMKSDENTVLDSWAAHTSAAPKL